MEATPGAVGAMAMFYYASKLCAAVRTSPPPTPPPTLPPPAAVHTQHFAAAAAAVEVEAGPSCCLQVPAPQRKGGRCPEGEEQGRSSYAEERSVPRVQDEDIVYVDDNNLASGSLDALIRHMVPEEDSGTDRAFLFAFLLTSRLFVAPHELLGRVFEVVDSQKSAKDRALPRLVRVLAEWMDTFPYDFRDERVMTHVRSLASRCVEEAPGVRKDVSLLLQTLLDRLTLLEKYEAFLAKADDVGAADSVDRLAPTDAFELCPCPTTMAQQLTLVELERMSYIGPEEFVQSFARERLETAARDAKRTKNLECYLQWCDRLSALVATEVCKNTSKERRRSESLEFWLEVARQAFNIGNFNSMMAIISGLGAQPVSRLSNTWTKALRGELNTLEKQMDADSDFYSYRSTLRASKWKNGSGGQRVIIPFFPLLLKDLYALCEDCSTRLPNGHVNFEASWRLATGVTEFVAWKQVVCRYENNSKVIAFLETSPTLTENALMLSSFECEGPTNDHEKEHYNFLRCVRSSVTTVNNPVGVIEVECSRDSNSTAIEAQQTSLAVSILCSIFIRFLYRSFTPL